MEEYRQLAREKHQRALAQAAQAQWLSDQATILRNCGYSEPDVQKLIKAESFADCINWDGPEWQDELLPWAFRLPMSPGAMGYNLHEFMLSCEVHHISAVQCLSSLGCSAEDFRQMQRQWNMVNPYPVRPLQPFATYALTSHLDPEDFHGGGSVRAPASVLRYLHTEIHPDEWSGPHPFLVVQMAFQNAQGRWDCDFAVLSMIPSETSGYSLSPLLFQRNQLTLSSPFHARLVVVQPVRSSDQGTGVLLEAMVTAREERGTVTDEELQGLLTQELERRYILVKNQWVALRDRFDQVWMYRVKRLWSRNGRPVRVVSTYGAQLSLQLEIPEAPLTPPSYEQVMQVWQR